MKEEKEKSQISIIDFPIGILESIFQFGIEAKRLRRIWFICFLASVGAVVMLTIFFFGDRFDSNYVLAFMSLAGGVVAAFLIAWINEVAREKDRKKRRFKFRKYYAHKLQNAKTKVHKSAILREIEERNLFEERPIFSPEEILEIEELKEKLKE